MKGLHFSFLGGIILVVLIVLVGMMLVQPVGGFDPKKYFGLQAILGEPGEIQGIDKIIVSVKEMSTRCGKFLGWSWTAIDSPTCTDNGGINMCTFQSEACSSGVPVSCATRTKYGSYDKTSGEVYGDDPLISIFIPPGQKFCRFVATGGVQARDVGVLCADVAAADVQYKWGGFENVNPIGTTVGCDAGFIAVAGMVESETFAKDDVDDRITGISTVSATITGTGAFKKKYGKVCLKDAAISACNIKEYNTTDTSTVKLIWDVPSKGGDRFRDIPCPGDSQLISCGGVISSPGTQSGLISLDSSYFADTKNGDMNIQGCEIVSSSDKEVEIKAVCAENLWYWSGWNTASTEYPTFDSPKCPGGGIAIACASDTDSYRSGYGDMGDEFNPGGGKYGEDALNSFYFKSGQTNCTAGARDRNGGNEHERRVGVLCVSPATYTAFFQATQPVDKEFNQPGAGGHDFQTFDSNNCIDGYLPVFCTIRMDTSDGKYTEDQITEINIDTAERKCKFTLADQYVDSEFHGWIGAVCAKAEKVVIKNDWNTIPWSPVIDFENPFFKSEPCTVGKSTMPLSRVQSGDTQRNYIISMVPTSTKTSAVLQAEDTWGTLVYDYYLLFRLELIRTGNEHQRKMGNVCLDVPFA